MLQRNIIPGLLLLAMVSCNEGNSKKENEFVKSDLKDTLLTSKMIDNPLATWASHSNHAFQLLELSDSASGTIYYFIDGYTNPTKIEAPYYFKAKAEVSLWNKNQLIIKTDKYKFYYDIWNDTLVLRDEAGIQEKLIRVYNDTAVRNQQF